MEILDDAYSEAVELDLYRDIQATSIKDFTLWGQPEGGYTSNKGLYIMVKKPINKGYLQFMYGVYGPADKDSKGEKMKQISCIQGNDEYSYDKFI